MILSRGIHAKHQRHSNAKQTQQDSRGGGASFLALAALFMPMTAAAAAETSTSVYQLSSSNDAPNLTLAARIPGKIQAIMDRTGGVGQALTDQGELYALNTGEKVKTPDQAGKILSVSKSHILGSDGKVYMEDENQAFRDAYIKLPSEPIKFESDSYGSVHGYVLTKSGDIYFCDGRNSSKIFDHTTYGVATDIQLTDTLLFATSKNKLYTLTFTDVTSTVNADAWLATSTIISYVDGNGDTYTDDNSPYSALSGYVKPARNTATSKVYIDGDSRLRDAETGLPYIGRRFSAVYQLTNTYAVEDTSFNHKEDTPATTMPQSGDPAAAWWQSAPYVVAVLTVVGAVVVVGLSRRRSMV